jgi:hypothetical protein
MASAKGITARSKYLAVVMNALKPIAPSDFRVPRVQLLPTHHAQWMYQMKRLDFCSCNQINEERLTELPECS